MLAGVFRRDPWVFNLKQVVPAYIFHGVTAVLALYLLLKALAA